MLLAGAIASVVLWADGRQFFGSLISTGSAAVAFAGIACAVAWVFVERKVAEPIIPLGLFANPTVSLLLVVSLMSGAVGIGFGQLCRALSADHDRADALAGRPAVSSP